jgi:outer membrane protein
MAVESVEGKSWDAKERFMIRARLINMAPDEESTTSLANTHVSADSAYAPELDISYFFTDHIAAELIAGTTQHSLRTKGATDLDLGDVWALPPTINLQYHFNPFGQFRPYAGAGLGYIIWYGEDHYGAGVTDVEYKNGMAYSLQAGLDIAIDDHWVMNMDVKKIFHNVDAVVNNGATADVDLDPWVTGVGIGYRF